MRTAIYVHKSSNVTIRPYDERDKEPMLFRYNKANTLRSAVGAVHLEAGIYLIKSYGPMQVTGGDVTVETTSSDKDIWPIPKLQVVALEPGATLESIQEFFLITKGVGD